MKGVGLVGVAGTTYSDTTMVMNNTRAKVPMNSAI